MAEIHAGVEAIANGTTYSAGIEKEKFSLLKRSDHIGQLVSGYAAAVVAVPSLDKQNRNYAHWAEPGKQTPLASEAGVASMLDINENSVSAVLLHDGWHHPITGTFTIDNIRLHAGASAGIDFGKSCAVWDEHAHASVGATVTLTAPLTSILAFQRNK